MKKISDRLDFFDKMLDLRNNHMEWAMKLNKNDIQQVAEMRGNNLYALLHEMDRQKTETKPLKVIVQELKYFGQ